MQGNRNPFIDNPYLATIIWGGPDAENLWPNMGLEENVPAKTEVFPNPANSFLKIKSNKQIESVSLYTITGRLLFSEIKLKDDSVDVSKYPDGTYILIVNYSDNSRESRKVLVKR